MYYCSRGRPADYAGWGAVFISSKNHIELGGRSDHATNNQMELTGPIEALKYLKHKKMQGSSVEIVSDSKYVILGITEWIFNWQPGYVEIYFISYEYLFSFSLMAK